MTTYVSHGQTNNSKYVFTNIGVDKNGTVYPPAQQIDYKTVGDELLEEWNGVDPILFIVCHGVDSGLAQNVANYMSSRVGFSVQLRAFNGLVQLDTYTKGGTSEGQYTTVQPLDPADTNKDSPPFTVITGDMKAQLPSLP